MGEQEIALKKPQSDAMAECDVQTAAYRHGKCIFGAKRRATQTSLASRDRHRTDIRSSEQRLEKWCEPFIPAVGKSRTEEIREGAPIGIKGFTSGGVEKGQPAVGIAAKIRHQSYILVEVVCDRGASAMQVDHTVAGRRRRGSPEGISREPLDLGSVVFRFVPWVHLTDWPGIGSGPRS